MILSKQVSLKHRENKYSEICNKKLTTMLPEY